MLRSILLFYFCINIVLGQEATKIVNLSQGPVRGYKLTDADVFAFRGIPYATEPKGNDRFKAPLAAPTWTETFDAKDSNICPQFFFSIFFPTPDNCLIVNVYSPNTTDENLPVFVFFHGGGFFMGFSDAQPPVDLVNSKKIVAVTVNYRLGIHGFLCLGTETAPGNAGMKDQNAALRWVKENIAQFGGNPNDVTIAGSSAGSVSVNLHLLSKMSRGLFHKLIADSAAGIAYHSTQQDPISNAKKFAKLLTTTIDVDDLQALEDFYLQVPMTELLKHALSLYDEFQIVPCVEKDLGSERFLEASPVSIMKSGDYPKLPKLEGFANMEGLLAINSIDEYSAVMNTDFSKYLPQDLEFESNEQKEEVAQAVKQFYFGNKQIGRNTALEFVDYFSDTGFTYTILKAIKWHLDFGMNQIYLYEYAFIDENTPYVLNTNEKGADHSSQTGAVLGSMLPSPESNEYTEMKATMQNLWLNFITTGQPVPNSVQEISSWPRVTTYNSPYMLLNQTSTLRTGLVQRRFEFWDKIYEKHYREPQPPNNAGNNINIFFIFIIITSVLNLI